MTRAVVVVLFAATGACSPPASDSQVAAGPGPLLAPEAGTSDARLRSPDFTSCALDSDCIAVPESGCCGPGAWVSVNRASAASYASAVCTDRMLRCPQIILVGPRVPECDNATHTCAMVGVNSIGCGGFVRNTHRCPEDYLCVHPNRIADLPGACVALGDAQATD
jgi:hypothetical protein